MEAVNGVSEVDKGGPPAPSPLTGCYLLIVVGEPHSKEHKDIILRRIAKGLLSWDLGDCHVDLEKELAIITEQAPEGEDARYGERLIQFASENLVTEILIHPAISTLSQCMKNLLSSFTRHRHIIHAGYTFAANGSWILQDGTFSLTDFSEAFQEIEVQRVLRAYDTSISLDIHCSPEGDWTRLPKESFAKNCKLRVNPNDVLTSGSPPIVNFLNYVSPFLVPTDIEMLLESSDVVGNIRFSHPTLYVFPGGQGDAALFGINGFNMLVDGGFARKACFWDFVRHLDRLDAVLLTRLNNSNVNGISSVLRRKRYNTVYPQIGHFFCNIQERKSILSPDGDKDKDPLLINLLEEGHEIVSNLRQLNLQPQVCYRDVEPINLYHKVGHGTLDMYVLSPARESKEVREFLQKWNTNDQRLFANQKNGREFTIPTQNLVSICALLVWQPANASDNITRILFPGSTPQHKIFEGLDRLKQLECIKHPTCSAKTLTPCLIKSKQSKADKIMQEQKDSKIKEKLVQHSESKSKVENKVAEENIKNVQSNGVATEQIIPEKRIKKHDSTESEKSGPQSGEIKKTDLDKDVANIVNGKSTDDKTVDKGRLKPKSDQKPKVDAKVYKHTRSIERKPKPSVEKKASPTTPKKTLNGEIKPKTPIKVSPSATPAKSAKDANNRKVVESKYKVAPKKETAAKPEKKEVKERKPISRRPKGASPTGKVLESPVKKLNELHKVEARKPKLEKEGTTDSSTVSTPSADPETTMKKDISKLTPEELEQLKARELAELKEEQEVVKEIEAVFQKSEHKVTDDSDLRKVKNISVDDKTEGEGEEYLIIEKEEIEHDSLDEKEVKESETQKHLRDSEESEKQRKLSGEIAVEEKTAEPAELIEHAKANDDVTPPTAKIKDEKEQPKELSKEISVTSPDEKVDLSSGKKITDRDGDEENKEANILESQPDEKFSTPIESGATTAPTLPEDERIPLDEIKEDNGDQAIEEKHVKEDTKEKEVPIVHLPPKTTEAVAKLPTVVGIRLDKQTPMRDLVKTPDEVADLPVHEEVDIENYEHFQATQSQTPRHEDSKHISSTKITPKPTQTEKESIVKTDENVEKISVEKETGKLSDATKHTEEIKTSNDTHENIQKDENAKKQILTAEMEEKKESKEVSKNIPEKVEEDKKVQEVVKPSKEEDQRAIKEIASDAIRESVTTILGKTEKPGEIKEDKFEKQIEVKEIKDKIVKEVCDKDHQELEQQTQGKQEEAATLEKEKVVDEKTGENLTEKQIQKSPLATHEDEMEKPSIEKLKDETATVDGKVHEDKIPEKIELGTKNKEVKTESHLTQSVQEKKEQVAVTENETEKIENNLVESSTKAEISEQIESKELGKEVEITQKQKIDEKEELHKLETIIQKSELEKEKDQIKASDKDVGVKEDQELVKLDTKELQEKASKSDLTLEDKTAKIEEKSDIKITKDLVKDSERQNQDDVEENIIAIEKELEAVISDKDKDSVEEKSDKPEKEQILESKDLTHDQIKQTKVTLMKKDQDVDKSTKEDTEIKGKEQFKEIPVETKETTKIHDQKTTADDKIDENKKEHVQKEQLDEPKKHDTAHVHVEETEAIEMLLVDKIIESTSAQKDIESQSKVTELQDKVEKKDFEEAEEQKLKSKEHLDKEQDEQHKLPEKEKTDASKELSTDKLSGEDAAAIGIESKLEQNITHDLKETDTTTAKEITSERILSQISDAEDSKPITQFTKADVEELPKVEEKDTVPVAKKSDDTNGLLESTKTVELESTSVTDITKDVEKLEKGPLEDVTDYTKDDKSALQSIEDQKDRNLKQDMIKDDIDKTDKRDEKDVHDIKDVEKISKKEFEKPKSEIEIEHPVVKHKEDTVEKLTEKSHQLEENQLKEMKTDKLQENDKISLESTTLIEKNVTEKQEKEECKEHIDDSTKETKDTILDVKKTIQLTESLHDIEQLDKSTKLTDQADLEKEDRMKEEKPEIETITEIEKKQELKESVPEISVEPPSITDTVMSSLELDEITEESKTTDIKKDEHQDKEIESKSTTDLVKDMEPELQPIKKEVKEVETAPIADKIQTDLKSDSVEIDQHQVKENESKSAANLVKDGEPIKKGMETAAIDKVASDIKEDSVIKESKTTEVAKDEHHEKEGEGKSVTSLVKGVEPEPQSIKKETAELETTTTTDKITSDLKLDNITKESKTADVEKDKHHKKEVEGKAATALVKDVQPAFIKHETKELETATITDKVTSDSKLDTVTKESKTADVLQDEQQIQEVKSKAIANEPERQPIKIEIHTTAIIDEVRSDTKLDSVTKESKTADVEKDEYQEQEVGKKSITDAVEDVKSDLPFIKKESKVLDELAKDEKDKAESTNIFDKPVDSTILKSDLIEPIIKDEGTKVEKEIPQEKSEKLDKKATDILKTVVREDTLELSRIDKKLQEMKEAIDTEDKHASDIKLEQETKSQSQSKKEIDIVDKTELGRKSPKEREQDVAVIVASVAEVLKSDAPLEEFEGKIPLEITTFSPYTPYTTELRETHITTVESPIQEVIVSDKIQMHAIEEEKFSPKDPTSEFLHEERKIAPIHTDYDSLQKDGSRVSSLIKDSTDLIQATSKIISDIKQSSKVDEDVVAVEEKASEVQKPLDDASILSKKDLEKKDIAFEDKNIATVSDAPKDTIPQSTDVEASLINNEVDIKLESAIVSEKTTTDKKEALEVEEKCLTSSGKSSPDIKESVKDTVEVDASSIPSAKSTPELKESKKETSDVNKTGIIETTAKLTALEKDQASGKTTPDVIDKSSIASEQTSLVAISKDTLITEKSVAASGKSTPEIIEPPKSDTEVGKSPVLSGKSTPDIVIDEDKSSIASGRLTPDTEELTTQKESSIPLSESSKSDITTVVSVQSTPPESATKQTTEQVHTDKPLTTPEICHVDTSSNVDAKQSTTDINLDKYSLDSVPTLQDGKSVEGSRKSIPDIKEVCKSETTDAKQLEHIQKSPASSGKTTPDLHEHTTDEKSVEGARTSIPDIKEVCKSETLTSDAKQLEHIQKSPASSGKTTPDLHEHTTDEKSVEGARKSIPDIKEVYKSETLTTDAKQLDHIQKSPASSGKTTPDLHEHMTAEKSVEEARKSIPDIKEVCKSETLTTDAKQLEHIQKSPASSGKTTPDLHEHTTDEKSVEGGRKSIPDIKEVCKSETLTTDAKQLEHIQKSPASSGKTTPDLHEHTTDEKSVEGARKSIPDIKEVCKSETLTTDAKQLEHIQKSPASSGKTTPDLHEHTTDEKSVEGARKSIPDIKEVCKSETLTSDANQLEHIQKSPASSGKTTPDLHEHTTDEKSVEGARKSIPDIKEVCKSETLTTDAKQLEHIQKSPASSGKTTPDLHEHTTDEKSVEEARKSIPDIKEVCKSETLTTDAKQLEHIQKSPASSGKTTPDLHEYTKNNEDLIKIPIEPEKSTSLSEQSNVTENLRVTETKDQRITSDTMTKGESIAGPSSSSKHEHLSLAKSPTDELELSRKSTPDIADIAKSKESEDSSFGRTTPPTVPVSPVVKEKRASLHDQENDDKKDVPELSALKTVDIRSSTPASDDCDISSGQVSRVLTTEEEDEKQVYSDDEDLPGSPLSATSQVAHSTSSQYDFEDSVRGVAQIDPMSTSFYGALPDDPIDLSKEIKTGRFLDESDLDFEKALFDHRQTRGEGLSSSSSPSHIYEITTAKYSSIKLQEDTQKPKLDESTSALQKESLMTSSFIGSELPKDPKDDPIASWGKPLGLPSPAPLNDNKGTPKKERKIPPSVMAKNKLNEDKKLSDSKYDKKGRKINPVYVDLTYVPHHGNSNYSYVDFFKRVRARYYVFSGIEPSKEVYTALLEAKQTWDDKELEVTIIPTYDTDVLGYWVAENEDLLAKCKIDLSPSASRCTINLQDHETSCSAYRLEFS